MSLEKGIERYLNNPYLYYPDGSTREPWDDELISTYCYIFSKRNGNERIKHYEPDRPNSYLYPYEFLVTRSDGMQKRIRLYAPAITMLNYLTSPRI